MSNDISFRDLNNYTTIQMLILHVLCRDNISENMHVCVIVEITNTGNQ